MKSQLIESLETHREFQENLIESRLPSVLLIDADWCGTCHIVQLMIMNLASQYEGQLKIFRMDIDAIPGLRDKYRIGHVPTLLFFNRGNVTDRVVGAEPKESLRNRMNDLLFQSGISKTINLSLRELHEI